MSDTIIAAMIALAGAGVGCFFTLVADFVKNKSENKRLKISLEAAQISSQKNMSVQYITNKRVDWIYEVRNTLAEYIALAQECANKKVLDKSITIPEKIYRELNVYLAKLRLLFNFDGDDDKKILDLLDNIKNNISAGEDFNVLNFQNDIILLTKYSQVYLKLEWERVKYEIRGEKDLTAEQMQANEISLLKEKYYHEYLKQERNN